jgi:hypothetical protein
MKYRDNFIFLNKYIINLILFTKYRKIVVQNFQDVTEESVTITNKITLILAVYPKFHHLHILTWCLTRNADQNVPIKMLNPRSS